MALRHTAGFVVEEEGSRARERLMSLPGTDVRQGTQTTCRPFVRLNVDGVQKNASLSRYQAW